MCSSDLTDLHHISGPDMNVRGAAANRVFEQRVELRFKRASFEQTPTRRTGSSGPRARCCLLHGKIRDGQWTPAEKDEAGVETGNYTGNAPTGIIGCGGTPSIARQCTPRSSSCTTNRGRAGFESSASRSDGNLYVTHVTASPVGTFVSCVWSIRPAICIFAGGSAGLESAFITQACHSTCRAP